MKKKEIVMATSFDATRNYEQTKKMVGYTPRSQTPPEIYARLGFKCGHEIHQQLKTEKKLFCHCPAGRYQEANDFDAEIIRHMRPTLSELGEYDGTALMEFKTRKNIVYRIKNRTTCTYEIDDTPPFKINPEALEIALEIALLLKTNIVGELHITRKQYLDGSIPTGFQRTAIVGIEGELPLSRKKVRVIQLSVEEDACREISDVGHWRVYSTDRLSMPLIETVTYPDLKTPDEAAEAAHYIRFLCRSTGKVRTGIGAAREDVNVSIEGGTRVEIKGVAHISWIPELTHNEAFRQRALLLIKEELLKRVPDPKNWRISSHELAFDHFPTTHPYIDEARKKKLRLVAVNLPAFRGLLSFFTQPGRVFADEISDRLKVIACLEKPNMFSSEQWLEGENALDFSPVRSALNAGENDAPILVWGPAEDIPVALDTIAERCRLAFVGVLNETRKAFADGRNMFERVLPGPDRMYPDTDSAPIPITEEFIDRVRRYLPIEVHRRLGQLQEWKVPADVFPYLLKNNLVPVIEKIVSDYSQAPRFVAILLGHLIKHLEGRLRPAASFDYWKLADLFAFIRDKKMDGDIVKAMLPVMIEHPDMDLESVLTTVGFKKAARRSIAASIPRLRKKFKEVNTSKDPQAEVRWIMGQLRRPALGNWPLAELSREVGRG